MSASTLAQAPQTGAARPQNISARCVTARARTRRAALVCLALLALAAAAIAAAWLVFRPGVFRRPDFEPAAVAGEPQVDERYGYSTLQVDQEYILRVCGMPANDGRTVEFQLTNPAESGVWFRAELLDGEGTLLASTGVLRPGEHLPALELAEPLTEEQTVVNLRVVGYEPHTWRSRGNVNLSLTLLRNFS